MRPRRRTPAARSRFAGLARAGSRSVAARESAPPPDPRTAPHRPARSRPRPPQSVFTLFIAQLHSLKMSRPGDANYDRYIYILQSLARLRFFLILADTGDENAMDLLQELVRCLLDCAQCVRAAGPHLRCAADLGRRRPFHPPTIRSVMLGIVNAILEELGPKGVPQAMLDVLLAALVAEVRGAADARGVGRAGPHAHAARRAPRRSRTRWRSRRCAQMRGSCSAASAR